MEAPQKFRTAWNGFHRVDVVQYLQFLNNKHQTQVNQLNMEIETLRAQMESMTHESSGLDEALSQVESLKEELVECQAQRDDLETKLEEANESYAALEGRCNALEQQLREQAPLDTYRHAETMERESRTRAELVYYQASGVLNQASTKVDGAAEQITALADQATESLTRLQMALSDSKHTLQDAAALMKAIRPNG